VYGSPMLAADVALEQAQRAQMKGSPVALSAPQRKVVADTIRVVCQTRGWSLSALNVRSNHVHVVVAAPDPPERVLHAFKSYATRRLREAGLQEGTSQLWSRHGSTRYLWKQRQVDEACRYVADSQGEDLGGEL